MEPFGVIGANFSLQLSSRTQFAKIKIKKKLSRKINVKNIKNWSLVVYTYTFFIVLWNNQLVLIIL